MNDITSVPGGRPSMVQAPVSIGHRPPMAGQSGPTMTPQDIIRVLKRHVFLIIAVFILFMIFTVIGTFIWARVAPKFTARALVEVKSPNRPQALGMQSGIANKDIIQQYMNTQANLLRSIGTLKDALGDPEIKQTSWYKSFDNDVNEALIDMQDRFSAAPIRDTWYLRVSFSWKDPKEAATITNVVLETYFREISKSSKGQTRNELSQYENRASALRDKLEQKVAQQERFRTARNIPLIQQRRSRMGDQVTSLTDLLAQAETQKDQAQALYEMYNQPGAGERMAETPEMRQMVEADFMVRSYTSQLADLQIQLASAEAKGPNNRVVEEYKTRIASVRKELNRKKAQLTADTFRDMRERTKVQLDTVNTQIMGLRSRLAEAKLQLADLESQLAQYLNAENEIKAMRDQLEQIEDYTMKLRIQLDDPELVRVTLAARAVPPLQRSSPQWKINIPAGCVLGIMLGVGLAFLIEFLPSTVKTSSDVAKRLNLSVLGQIPSQDDDEASAENMNKLLLESPHSMLAESFRQLRANFLFSAPADQQKSVLITSCSPSEGKTCLAVNLATSLALAGKKILLVDANFHRPGIAEAFDIKDAKDGLSNILIGDVDADSLIRHTPHENLDIISSGPLPPNAAELLSRGHLKDFIAQYSQKYDTIFFDGPPLLVISDALVLASSMDGVVLVIRAGISSRGAIGRAKDQMKRANAKLFGVILNDVRISRGGYFREMYQTYYDYQSQGSLPTDEDEAEAEEKEKEKEKEKNIKT